MTSLGLHLCVVLYSSYFGGGFSPAAGRDDGCSRAGVVSLTVTIHQWHSPKIVDGQRVGCSPGHVTSPVVVVWIISLLRKYVCMYEVSMHVSAMLTGHW